MQAQVWSGWQVSGAVQAPHEPPQPSAPHSLPAQSGVQHWKEASHTAGAVQLPQLPPQPSAPHSLPAQAGTQAQVPLAWQVSGAVQAPQLWVPQTGSIPHSRPVQFGAQTHWPLRLQVSPAGQEPHEPPQPSAPHSLPPQAGTQAQVPLAWQVSGAVQAPQFWVPQTGSSPHSRPAQLGVQFATHWPLALQVSGAVQAPQFWVPQTGSSPHSRPAQLGVQFATHRPLPLQVSGAVQVPQLSVPQTGSMPHSRPAQLGVQPAWHWPTPLQLSGAVQVPQLWVPQTGSMPHSRPWQSGLQPAWHWPLPLQLSGAVQVPHSRVPQTGSMPHSRPWQSGLQPIWHWPLPSQLSPAWQVPQEAPQPSSPHSLPAQFDWHGPAQAAAPLTSWQVWPARQVWVLTQARQPSTSWSQRITPVASGVHSVAPASTQGVKMPPQSGPESEQPRTARAARQAVRSARPLMGTSRTTGSFRRTRPFYREPVRSATCVRLPVPRGRGMMGRMNGGPWTWLRRHAQLLFNLGLFGFFAAVMGRETYAVWAEGRLDYVELSFAVQNAVMVALILLRRPHQAVDRNPLRQALALTAFLSGVFFMGEPPTGGATAVLVSGLIVFAANVLGLATLVNLGRSFGILIALRKVETRFLYSLIRHPMYATDILLRVGYLVSHLSWYTGILFALSTFCYGLRAVLEERFLAQQDPAYQAYMQRTRWRFLPGIF